MVRPGQRRRPLAFSQQTGYHDCRPPPGGRRRLPLIHRPNHSSIKPMHSARIASYPCRIERGAPDWTISFRDVPQALAGGRGVPAIFEVAESALVAALDALRTNPAHGLPAASAPAPGEVMVTVRLGGPPLVRTPPPGGSSSGSDSADEDVPVIAGEIVDVSTETSLVPVRRRGLLSRLFGWLTRS